MKNAYIFSIILIFTSCSSYSLKKSILYSCGVGALAGGGAGYMLAPGDTRNKALNGLIFGGISCAITGALGYLFHVNNPLKKPLQEREKRTQKEDLTLNLGKEEINITPKFSPISSYKQKAKDLPKELNGIFPTPYVEIHKMEDQLLEQGERSIYLRGCEAIVQTVGSDND